jgi:heptosyltransferase-1
LTRVLLIKTSSLGDVINALPAVSDMRRRVPGLTLDWVVEEQLSEIPRLHPAVTSVIPVRMRQWRSQPLAGETWSGLAALRRRLSEAPYDRVIDAQGLIRTSWLGRLARGPYCGYDLASIREPLACLFYDRRFSVGVTLHAAERMRRLTAQAMGYPAPSEVEFGLAVEPWRPAWLGEGRYLVMLHATARPGKAWASENWIELGRRAAGEGLTVVTPWGSEPERARAEAVAAAVPGALVAPAMRLSELAALMAGAAAVVGVDTGLAHLASAVGAPVVALYLASWSEFNGVIGPGFIANLGEPGAPPTVETVWAKTREAMAFGRREGSWPAPLEPHPDLAKRRRFRPSNSGAVVHRR